MPCIVYKDQFFRGECKRIIPIAREILEENYNAGFTFTLRQLYYQLVANNHIPNTERSYKKLIAQMTSARLGGAIDWDYLEDRTRNVRAVKTYDGPRDALRQLSEQYEVNPWINQNHYVEVWIEKDALVGVIQQACNPYLVPFFSCRGYTSLSEMYECSQRMKSWESAGYKPIILHLGDHDPSGIDMSRDIQDRLNETFQASVKVKRIAMTMEQVRKYKCPPNPAKITDVRYKKYRAEYGKNSWELDALSPSVIVELIQKEIKKLINKAQWDKDIKDTNAVKSRLVKMAKNWRNK